MTSTDLSAVDKIRLSRPAFLEWLRECRGRGFLHGYELVRRLAMADNVREADVTLQTAERLGLITSTGCRPTVEQQFFGIGGLAWSSRPAVLKAWKTHRSTHGWEATDESVAFLEGHGMGF